MNSCASWLILHLRTELRLDRKMFGVSVDLLSITYINLFHVSGILQTYPPLQVPFLCSYFFPCLMGYIGVCVFQSFNKKSCPRGQ